MNIQEIKIEKFPLVIITDTHCHIKKINVVRGLYPQSSIICLGDITDLFNKKDAFNKHSIQFFMDNKIPCLRGNHEEHIIACVNAANGETLYQWRADDRKIEQEYRIEKTQIEYLRTLPIGFKLILPDGSNYLGFHNFPKDLWSFTDPDDLSIEQFKSTYPLDDKTLGVLHGHMHKTFKVEYDGLKAKRYGIGTLKQDEYALLTEQGIEFKKI